MMYIEAVQDVPDTDNTIGYREFQLGGKRDQAFIFQYQIDWFHFAD